MTTPGYIARAGYVPRAQVSPSSIKLARTCERAWGYRYILGYKEPEKEWRDFAPGGPLAQRPKDKEALKAWNRLRRPALGKEIHRLLEDWYAGRPVDWHGEPGKILLPALLYFPTPSNFIGTTEEKISDQFVQAMSDGRHRYEFNAYIDLNGFDKDEPNLRCLDAKSTSDFQWVLKPEELLLDTQGINYPLYTMWKRRQAHAPVAMTESIVARWVYMRTEGEPAARAVDFRVTYDGARRRALPIFDEGAQLIAKINDRADPNELQSNSASCNLYHRKCIYHHSVGGPCKAESSPGKMARAFLSRGSNQEKIVMAFQMNKPKTETVAPEGSSQPDSAPVEAGEGAVEQTEEQKAAGKRTYRARAPKAAGSAPSAGAITVTFADGNTLELPESSPVAGKLSAIHAAMFGE